MTDANELLPDEAPVAPEPVSAPPAIDDEDAASSSLNRALRLSFLMLKLLMLVIVLLFVLDCARQIDQNEVGLVRRFGRYRTTADGAPEVLEPGLHFIWPEPVEQLERVSLGKRELTLDAVFWPWTGGAGSAAGESAPTKENFDPAQDGYNLTGDLNLVHTRWTIEYTVDRAHPEDYLTTMAALRAQAIDAHDHGPAAAGPAVPVNPAELLRAVAESVIVRCIAGMSVDDVLIARKDELRLQVRSDIERDLQRADAPNRYLGGLKLLEVNLNAAVAPGRVKTEFDAVIQALSKRAEEEDNARADAAGILAKARADASKIVRDAEVYKTEVVAGTQADADYIRGLVEKYPDNPRGLQAAMDKNRLDLIRERLGEANLIIMQPGDKGVLIIAPSTEDYRKTPESTPGFLR